MENEKLDLIDRGALGIGKAKREAFNNPAYADGWNCAIDIIENAPTVDARPVVHGRWEERYVPNGKYVAWDGFYCSVCGRKAAKTKYCPFCGSQMDGGNEDGQ